MKAKDDVYQRVTYYEVFRYIRNTSDVILKCFKRESESKAFDEKNAENLEIINQLCMLVWDDFYCQAVLHLIEITRGRFGVSEDDELIRSHQESLWLCFLQNTKVFIDEYDSRIGHMTTIREEYIQGIAHVFSKREKQKLVEMHLRLRGLFFNDKGVSVLETVALFIAKHYKKEIKKRSGELFFFNLNSRIPLIPMSARKEF